MSDPALGMMDYRDSKTHSSALRRKTVTQRCVSLVSEGYMHIMPRVHSEGVFRILG